VATTVAYIGSFGVNKRTEGCGPPAH